MIGLTLMEAGLLVILFMVVVVVPLLYVMLHGDAPVNETETFADEPVQSAIVPESVAVGFAFTVITTLLVALQPFAVSTSVYVVVTVGLTDGFDAVDVKPEGLEVQL